MVENMGNDIWHYPRTELAKQVLGMFETGLSNALVFFAPRRMGKTEFLLKDMRPLSEKKGWHVLYFSFLDSASNAVDSFTNALVEFAFEIGAIKKNKRIKKITGGGAGIQLGVEFGDLEQAKVTLKEVTTALTKSKRKVLLLLDEVQVLSEDRANKDFIAALRTLLDINKDSVKVIFTGSSREGLRQMFSKSDAPFFHFGQNLPFPELDEKFIDHLAVAYHQATQRELSVKDLWQCFVEMGKVPQLIRSLVERLVLHPNFSLRQLKKQMMDALSEDREYVSTWCDASILEQLILQSIVQGESALFSESKRIQLAEQMGLDSLTVSNIQSAIRSLQRRKIIGNSLGRGEYFIDDPNFQKWIEGR